MPSKTKPTLAAIFLSVAFSAGCQAPADPRQTGFAVERPGITANYDKNTGKLSRIVMDQNKNGRMDTFSYWDGTRVLRIEIDTDEDGKIDRWEHYDDASKMTKLGSSSRDDQIEDTWSYPDDAGFLARVETDTDRDGVIDKRETFAPRPGDPNSRVLRLVELGLDRAGRPERQLYYTPDGAFEKTVAGDARLRSAAPGK